MTTPLGGCPCKSASLAIQQHYAGTSHQQKGCMGQILYTVPLHLDFIRSSETGFLLYALGTISQCYNTEP